MIRNVRKRTFGHVRPVKIQTSLRIRAVWSESSLGVFCITKDAKFLHAYKEYSDRTARNARFSRFFMMSLWLYT